MLTVVYVWIFYKIDGVQLTMLLLFLRQYRYNCFRCIKANPVGQNNAAMTSSDIQFHMRLYGTLLSVLSIVSSAKNACLVTNPFCSQQVGMSFVADLGN